MKPTLEQLNELSDYELNCETAEKLGHVVLKRGMGDDILIKTMTTARPVNYCNNPNDYMPIAIKYKINIVHSLENRDNVTAMYIHPYGTPMKVIIKERFEVVYPAVQTGRAVVIAFLLMGDE